MKKKEILVYIFLSVAFSAFIVALIVNAPRITTYIYGQIDYPTALITIDSVPLGVFLADTESLRTRGLSYREMLGKNQGMLFVFDKSDKYGIWMKEMRFPIDIIWLDSKMKVVDIIKNLAPETYPKIFKPQTDAKFVLEVNAGFSDENKIKIGSEMIIYK